MPADDGGLIVKHILLLLRNLRTISPGRQRSVPRLCLIHPIWWEIKIMETIELQLDEQTLERARQFAESRRCTLEELISEIIGQLGTAGAESDPFLGMFAGEPELMDQVVASAMKAREDHPLRQTCG